MQVPLVPTEGISALLGALVGGFITYCFSLSLAEKQFQQLRQISKLDAKYAAAARFREAFAEELVALECDDLAYSDITDFLRKAYSKHARAVVEFQALLGQEERRALQCDWNYFRFGENDDGSICFPDDGAGIEHSQLLHLCYGDLGCTFETHINLSPTQKAITRINRLLRHGECA